MRNTKYCNIICTYNMDKTMLLKEHLKQENEEKYNEKTHQ